jgi:hypothetical protein
MYLRTCRRVRNNSCRGHFVALVRGHGSSFSGRCCASVRLVTDEEQLSGKKNNGIQDLPRASLEVTHHPHGPVMKGSDIWLLSGSFPS